MNLSHSGVTEEQKAKICKEYEQLPKASDGRIQRGLLRLLARKWNISANALWNIVKRPMRSRGTKAAGPRSNKGRRVYGGKDAVCA